MKDMFSVGELSKYQKISKQTLIFYDKIGLFKPAYIDPENGYRYYSAEQIDYLDTILIMKKIGFSLEDIKNHMKNFNKDNSLALLKNQLSVIEKEIDDLNLIKSRLLHRCSQMEHAVSMGSNLPKIELFPGQYILYHNVEAPNSMKEISIASKKCYAQALRENLPVFYQCGVRVPLKNIAAGRFTEASTAFLTTDRIDVPNLQKLPQGLTACIYHFGDYYSIGKSYEELLEYCRKNRLSIISDSCEFCINDYITSKDEKEFITKIMFYVEEK